MKLRIISAFSIIFFFLANSEVSAQYFSVGNSPAKTKWRQIDHPGFRFIYPDYFEKQARQVLDAGLNIIDRSSGSMYLDVYPIRTVIRPETIVSNAWTMWVPRKLELSVMPSLYPLAERYSDHLLIHEFRHFAQLDKMDQGLTKVLGLFFGDQAYASVQALHIPEWVSEGDAVLTETLLSHSGRGRSPVFSQGMRAKLLNGYEYKLDKARFGSYRDFIPNYYVLGYHMVSIARISDSLGFWSEAHDHAATRPYIPGNFSRFLKKRTGLKQAGLYDRTNEFLSDHWEKNQVDLGQSQNELIKEDQSDYMNYIKPFSESDSSWICLKKSYSELAQIIRIYPDASEEKVLFTGSINADSYSYANGKIIWAMQIADPRWEMRSFSDLFVFDIEADKKIRITKKQRYFYPVINPEGDKIACIKDDIYSNSSLMILDFEGELIDSCPAPEGYLIRQPVWGENDDEVYGLLSGRDGKKLIRWKVGERNFEIVHDFAYKEINQLSRYAEYILFTAPIGTNQGLYAFSLKDGSISRALSSENGLAYPTVVGGSVSASIYTPEGYRPGSLDLQKERWKSTALIDDYSEPILSQIQRAESEYPIDYEDKKTDTLTSKKYSKYDHLFNFHSWAPVFFDVDEYSIRPGAMLISQNDLNSLVSSFGIQHNKQSKSLDLFADLTYTGWYPEIGLNVLGGKRLADTLLLSSDTLTNVSYSDISSSLFISIPLFYSKGAYYQRIQPYLSLTYHNVFNGISEDTPSASHGYFDLSYGTLRLGLAGQLLRRMSYRDLYPKWGFTAGLMAEAGISNPEVQASRRISGYIRTYSPGILKHHSLRAYAGYTAQNELGLTDIPFVSLPRGHYVPTNYDYSSYKLDYSFPFAYPDWSIPSIAYITRLKANLFSDALYTNYMERGWSVKTGIDLTSNFYLFRLPAEIDAGVRIIYDPLENEWDYELLFSMDID